MALPPWDLFRIVPALSRPLPIPSLSWLGCPIPEQVWKQAALEQAFNQLKTCLLAAALSLLSTGSGRRGFGCRRCGIGSVPSWRLLASTHILLWGRKFHLKLSFLLALRGFLWQLLRRPRRRPGWRPGWRRGLSGRLVSAASLLLFLLLWRALVFLLATGGGLCHFGLFLQHGKQLLPLKKQTVNQQLRSKYSWKY